MGHRTLRWTLTIALFGAIVGCAEDTSEIEAEAEGWPEEEAVLGRGLFAIDGEELELAYRAINGHLLFEGDVVLDEETLDAEALLDEELAPDENDVLEEPGELADESDVDVAAEELFAVSSDSRLWPRGRIPYTIHSSVSTPGRVREAIRIWEATGVDFVPRTTQRAYVTFIEDPGHPVCSAQVGYTGARRYVYMRDTSRYSACNLGVMVHEIGHTLGLWHEHTRPDRNTYVTIHWSFVPSAYREAYEIKRSGVRRVGAYDINSSMHYRSTTLTRTGGSAITRRDGTRLLHDWATLSRGDVAAIRTLYFDGTPVPRPEAGTRDAGAPDAGARDAGLRDAGARDAGVPDAGPVARPDAGPYVAYPDATGMAPLPIGELGEVMEPEPSETEIVGYDVEEDRTLRSSCSASPGRGAPIAASLFLLCVAVGTARRARRHAS